jgi:hypothetical protein
MKASFASSEGCNEMGRLPKYSQRLDPFTSWEKKEGPTSTRMSRKTVKAIRGTE